MVPRRKHRDAACQSALARRDDAEPLPTFDGFANVAEGAGLGPNAAEVAGLRPNAAEVAGLGLDAAKGASFGFRLLHARRLATATRAGLALVGIALAVSHPDAPVDTIEVSVGFAAILLAASVLLLAPKISGIKEEEWVAVVAAVLIVGLQSERITAFSLVWLAAVATGVMARGGRVHLVGRAAIAGALALPIARSGTISTDYVGFCVATVGLLMTSVRLTGQLNDMLLQARYDADHDDLTGLLSRAAFRAALERASARALPQSPISLLLLDLDSFGKVNKVLGHAAGDALLAATGRRLLSAGEHHCTVGRLGGDEFAVIVPSGDPMRYAQRIVQALEQCGENGRQVCACIGISQAPADGHDADSLLMASDIALRVAKRSRRGSQISTYAGQSLSGEGRRNARDELRRLIDGEGISVAVQPIVDLRTGAVHAYEALARFHKDASKSPLHWFSLADELESREELERACLSAALQLLPQLPPATRLCVNLSAPVLLDPKTLTMLSERSEVSELIVEVTEEALVTSEPQLQSTLRPLLARGARLAVDDMGAGYSGLRQVTAVRPHYLKVDRSLINGIDQHPERAALVGALAGYAERVGSLLVAEGVETEEELKELIALKVPLAQGFYLARPDWPWPSPPVAQVSMQAADYTAALSLSARS